LDNIYNDSINNLTYDKAIERMTNTKKINEVIYNTYDLYKDNYYNSVNINKILLSYLINKHIKNKIMKRLLNDRYEEIIDIILKKRDEDNKMKIIREKEEKKKLDDKLQEIIKENEEYKKAIKEIKEIKKIKEKEEEYKKEIKEKEEKYKKEIEELKKKISHKYLKFYSYII